MNIKQNTLAALLVLGIGMSGCNTTNTLPTTIKVEKSEAEASQTIVDYAVDNTKPVPTVQDYTDAKITGVNADNLATINAKLSTLATSIAADNVVDLVQKMVNDVINPVDRNGTDPENNETNVTATILESIGSQHSKGESNITVAQLKAITPALRGIKDDYQDLYRTYIASANNSFSSPATRDEVQNMINVVDRNKPLIGGGGENNETNVTATILESIGSQHSDHNSTITVAQLKTILPALRDINDDYQDIYRSYIASADTNISSPATVDEVQSMINEVNDLNLPTNAILDRSFFKKTNGAFEHRFVYLAVESNTTGRTWLNNNLGADYANVDSSAYNPSQQATAIKDLLANGSLFQWGRKADGHELIEWSTLSGKYATTATKSDNPDDSLLITGSDDWRVTSDDTLWASESSPNNVCPVGYRLPLSPNGANDGENEWYQETKDLTQNIGGLFHSFLKVSTTGIRNFDGNASIIWSDGGSSNYWSGSVRSDGKALNMGSNWGVLVASDYGAKIEAHPVRCIKDQTPAERVATILKEIGNEHRNHKSTVTVAQLKAITPALNHINDDYENTYRTYIASADKSFSSPATVDELQSMIDEVNRLVPASEATRTLIATQHSNGSSTITVAQLKAIDLLNNVQEANEKFYQSYIEGDTHFSSPATREELQSMIDEVNSFNLPDNAILDKNFYKKTHNKFEHRFVYLPVTNSNTGRTWLNNNLGAWYANVGRNIYNPSQQATNANDNYAKGSLFQWGRKADGHELVTRWWGNGTIDQLATTTTKSDNPTDGKFIAVNSDWRVHPNDDLWKGINAPNNPCPAHYRVPTKKELDVEAQTWNALTADGSMSSRLKIPGPGWLNSNGYGMFYPGGAPRIWDTTPGVAWRPHETHSLQRTNGLPLRCIKEQTPAERSASVLLEIGRENLNDYLYPGIGNEYRNHKSIITIEDLKAITPALNHINDNHENIYRTYIASADKSFSSPATRDEVQQMITEIRNLNLPAHAIVDRSFFKKTNNEFEHKFVYLPVTNSTTGRTWLNNNLGADYANMDSSNYNPLQQAKSKIDPVAYGSEFQWGREADGHELMTWTDATHGTGKYGVTKTQNDNPTDSLFIAPDISRYNGKYNWRVHPDSNLWKGVDAPNNPCPIGYRLPTNDQTQPAGANNEWLEEGVTWKSEDSEGAYDSKLKMTLSGWRDSNGNRQYAGTLFGIYWSSSAAPNGMFYRFLSHPSNYHTAYWNSDYIAASVGQSIRCIKN